MPATTPGSATQATACWNGGTGSDTMDGGAGADIYVVDAAGDVVTEAGNRGTDTVRA